MMTRARLVRQSEILQVEHAAGERIGVVADTHGALDSRVAARLAGCDLLVHAGDVGSVSVLDALREIAPRLVAVRGNNDVDDKWPPEQCGVAASLPRVARIALPGGVLAVEHGDAYAAHRRHQRLRAAYPDTRVVVYGHSHRLVVDREAWPWVLNPGAAGRTRTLGGPSCLVVDLRRPKWRIETLRFAPPGRRNA